MLFLIFILINIRRQQKIDTFEANGDLKFITNETIQYYQESYFIQFNTQQELDQMIKNKQYFEISNLIHEFQITEIRNISKIHIFNDELKQHVKVCISNSKEIFCKFIIDTMFINGNLQLRQNDTLLTLPSENCENIQYLNLELYLIQCKINTEQNHLYIMDDSGKIYDTFESKTLENCLQEFSTFENTIIVYCTKCNNSIIQLLQIDEETKTFSQQNKINFESFYDINFGQLYQVQICKRDQIFLNFEQHSIIFSISSPQHPRLFTYNQKAILYQEDCRTKGTMILETEIIPSQFKKIIDTSTYLFLNLSHKEIKKFQFVNENFLYQTESQLTIVHSQDINQTIINVIDFKNILELPIIITIFKNQTLMIKKINQISNYIEYQNKNYLAILQKNPSPSDMEIKILKTQLYDIQNKTNLAEVENNSQKIFIQEGKSIKVEDVQKYFPFSSIQIKSSNACADLKQPPLQYCSINFNTAIQFIKAIYEGECFSVLYSIQDEKNKTIQKIYLQNCCQNSKQQFIYISNSDQTQKIFYYSKTILQIRQYSVNLFYISNNFDVLLKQIFDFDSEILEVQEQKKNIVLYLSNGKLYKITYNKSINAFLSEIYRYQNPKKQNKISFNSFEIQLKKTNFQFDYVLRLDCEIISQNDYVNINRYVIVCIKNDNTSNINLYSYNDRTIQLLFQYPLYEFKIILPIKISYNEDSFGILVNKDNFITPFLLLYKVKPSMALQSLFSIIRIDDFFTVNYFDFEQRTRTIICGANKCKLYLINQGFFQIISSEISDKFELLCNLHISTQLYILDRQKDIELIFSYLNENQTLRFRLDVQQNDKTLQINHQNELQGLEKTFGAINNISISPTCQGILLNPIEKITNFSFVCQSAYQQFCFQGNKTMIFDPFGIHQVIEFHPHIQILEVKLIFEDSNLLKIFYINFFNQYILLVIDDWKIYSGLEMNFQTYTLNDSLLKSQQIYKIQNVFFSDYDPKIIIFNDKYEILVDQQFVNDFYHYIINTEHIGVDDLIRITRIAITNQKILKLNQFQIFGGHIQNIFDFEFRTVQNVQKFIIYDIIKQGNLLQVRVILEESSVSSVITKIILLKITFDMENKMVVSEQIIHYFRIGNFQIQRLQVGESLLVLILSQSKNQTYFYDLKQSLLNLDISDSYFYLNSENNLVIQQYNQSHQVKYSWPQASEIFLVNIQSYKLIKGENCQISLYNEISSMSVSIAKQHKKTNYLILNMLIAFNLIFIIFIIANSRKKHINNNKNY